MRGNIKNDSKSSDKGNSQGNIKGNIKGDIKGSVKGKGNIKGKGGKGAGLGSLDAVRLASGKAKAFERAPAAQGSTVRAAAPAAER